MPLASFPDITKVGVGVDELVGVRFRSMISEIFDLEERSFSAAMEEISNSEHQNSCLIPNIIYVSNVSCVVRLRIYCRKLRLIPARGGTGFLYGEFRSVIFAFITDPAWGPSLRVQVFMIE